MADINAPTYHELLVEAQEIGRADGRFAAAFECTEASPGTGTRCLGRSPAEFARLLWGDGRGPVPAGLEVNAPLWYAAGYAEAVAEVALLARLEADATGTRRVFT